MPADRKDSLNFNSVDFIWLLRKISQMTVQKLSLTANVKSKHQDLFENIESLQHFINATLFVVNSTGLLVIQKPP